MDTNMEKWKKKLEEMSVEELRAEVLKTLARQGGRSGWQQATSNKDIPNQVGVYVIYDAMARRVMYIGSGVLRVRASLWFKKKWPCYVKWKIWKRQWMALCVEMELIERIKPPLNQRGVYKVRLGEQLSPKQIKALAEEALFEGKTLSKAKKAELKAELNQSLREMRESKQWVEQWMYDLPSPPPLEKKDDV